MLARSKAGFASLVSTIVLLATGSSAFAQTYIVDSNQGPGTSFTDIPQAVAAVPSGATLHVRPGTYSPFTIAGKSLRLIGHADATGFPEIAVASPSQIRIGPLTAAQSVEVSGLQFPFFFQEVKVDITSCAGAVLLEDVRFDTLAFVALTVTDSPNVHIRRLLGGMRGVYGRPTILIDDSSVELSSVLAEGSYVAPGGGLPALEIRNGGRVVAVDCFLTGGSGSMTVQGAGDGGPAVLATGGSTLHLYGNSASGQPVGCRGGFGGQGVAGGAGGDGLVLTAGSFARVHGLTLVGGLGTFGFPNGQPFTVDATSSIDYDPIEATPSGLLAGTVLPGSTVRFTLFARPGTSMGLLAGVTGQFAMLPVLHLGALGTSPVVSLATGAVPAGGKVELAWTVPTTWPDNSIVLAQFVVFDPATAELTASNLFTVISRY